MREAKEKARGIEIARAGRVDDPGDRSCGDGVGLAALDDDRALFAPRQGRDLRFLARPSSAFSKESTS